MSVNLTKVETTEGLEIYIDNTTGESFTSVSGYARMSGLNKSNVSRRLQTFASGASKTAEILTTTGLKTVVLLTENTITEWLVKDNPALLGKFAAMGIRKYIHTLAGFNPQAAAPIALTEDDEIAKAYVLAYKKIERLEEAAKVLYETNVHLNDMIAEIKPKADIAEKFIESECYLLLQDFVKSYPQCGFGRNLMFKFLRDKRVLDGSNNPFQLYVNKGYFVVKPNGGYHTRVGYQETFTTYLTAAGVEWLINYLAKNNKKGV
jgi:phage antirepressor YoqD-like protein